MEKVYVVYESYIYDYEDNSSLPRVFTNLEDAQKYMKSEFEIVLLDIGDICTERYEKDTICEAWEDGDYTRNHYKIMIQGCEIE